MKILDFSSRRKARTVLMGANLLWLSASPGLVLAQPAATPSAPDAQTRSAARDLARQAREFFIQQKWEKARELYHRAYQLIPAPTLAVREARCLVQLGRLVEAEEVYLAASRTPLNSDSPKPFQVAVQEANAELLKLRPRVPRLKVIIAGVDSKTPGLEVRLDGKPVHPALLEVDRPTDPGLHTLEAFLNGASVSESFTLKEGQQRSIELKLDPAEATPEGPDSQKSTGKSGISKRTWGWVGVGVGSAGLALGVVQGIIATGKKSDLDDQCPNSRCPPSAQDDLDSFRSARTISTVGYAVGAVGLGAGVAILLTTPVEKPKPTTAKRVEPWVSWGSMGVRGSF